MKTVQDIMTKEVWSVKAEWSLEALSQFFFDKNITGAPVVDRNDKLLGVVSITDLARSSTISPTAGHEAHDYYVDTRIHSGLSQEDLVMLRVESESAVTVKDIMTPMIFEVEQEANVEEVARMMLKGHIHRVFVTLDKEVVGVVTTMDMLKVIGDYS
ncbi:MAG: CBS domain-containing protein [Gammaproteobacteria bacterium]|jgi:predicted transcriptional regulator|nr:CBS domain-containing protein [Gammaproteobacteria bacterium]